MKLIDLLVQELPQRGGWPDAYYVMAQDEDGKLAAYHPKTLQFREYYNIVLDGICDKYRKRNTEARDSAEMVTFEQYEAALAASKKVEWNGEGLPPVGCECQYTKESLPGDEWTDCTIDYIGASFAVYRDCYGVELTGILGDIKFRPIRSEADKKRDEAVEEMMAVIDYRNGCSAKPLAGWLYDAIADGKIPHIRIE